MTSFIRLKAVPPHFVAHVEASAPNINMRLHDLGKDLDPGLAAYPKP
jgi:hypothetical protein